MQDFKSIIEANHPILFKIARVYSEDIDFDDLYQEMLINVWKSLRSFKGDSKVSTWLYRVALNTALSFKRNKNRKSIPSVDIIHAQAKAHEHSTEKEELEIEIERLYAAIRKLKKEERSLILLYLEEKTYDEIADIIGITKTNVGVKVNRIKKKLYELLKP